MTATNTPSIRAALTAPVLVGALGYFVGGQIGALWSKWPTQRVLILLSVLPMIGAALVWVVRPGGVQESET